MSRSIKVRSGAELPQVHIARLRADDVLVFHFEHHLPDKELERLIAGVTEQFPDNKVMVLDAGAKLSVVRRDGE